MKKRGTQLMRKNGMKKLIIFCIAVLMVFVEAVMPVNAMTVFESDGIYHDEGYIFIGESHSCLASRAVSDEAFAVGNVFHWGENNDVSYRQIWDAGRAVTQKGEPNTFAMKGNLFFIFEGIDEGIDDKIQVSREYIYSDGMGKQGRAVEKIHEIINTNPNIAHWNIISMHGAVSASQGTKEIADYYVRSYRNWIDYEFPEADCYFLSIATMTKFYRPIKDKKIFNNTIAAAFPDNFLDYTDFYTPRSPARMIDTIHWDNATYVELIESIVRTVKQRREMQPPVQAAVNTGEQYTVEEVYAILLTNDMTVVYAEPSLDSGVILPSCEAGIPVQVTGVTSNGFFRIRISPDGVQYYVQGNGLSQLP